MCPVYCGALVIASLFFIVVGLLITFKEKYRWQNRLVTSVGLAVVGDIIVFLVLYFSRNSPGMQSMVADLPEYPVTIYSYGSMLQIAEILAVVFIIVEGTRAGIRIGPIIWLLVLGHFTSLLGARLLYIALHIEEFQPYEIPETGMIIPGAAWWDLSRGGLSAHGAMLGGFLAVLIISAIFKLKFLKLADIAAVAAPIFVIVGRIGCFMNGCCYGLPFADQVNAPWFAVRYPTEKIPPDSLMNPPYPMDGLFRHPAPVYMAIGGVFLFFYLWYFWRRKARFPGQTFLMFLFLYSLLRFIQEMYRLGESSKVIGGWCTYAQLASIIIAVVAGVIMLEINRRIIIAERLAAEGEGAVEFPVTDEDEIT
jgi:phosphatidylglycerol:prolipoprotein diacylglycerol transferase